MTTTPQPLDLDALRLASGGHPPGDAMCVMEAVAYDYDREMKRHMIMVALIGVVLLASMIGVAIAYDWYRSGVQQRVYARQGIEMTQWEIFMGAEPAQKAITIKPAPTPDRNDTETK